MLTIIRGIPGSGKTTLALQMNTDQSKVHVEADMFFMEDGVYVYDANRIKKAHQWCFEQTEKALQEGKNVIVSNTFVKRWEVDPYLELAKKHNAPSEILVCEGNYKSIHNVPEEVIQRMKNSWENFDKESDV